MSQNVCKFVVGNNQKDYNINITIKHTSKCEH